MTIGTAVIRLSIPRKHVDSATRSGMSPDEALAIAAASEHDAEHTIGQGIVKSAEERGLRIPKAERFQAIPGRGR